MQCKLCLVLALAVLLGSLAVGNPFLTGNGAVALRAPTPSSAAAPAAADAAAPAPVAAPPVAAPAVARRGAAAVAPQSGRQPAALLPAALLPECPDPALRPLVVRVASDGGAPVWVLRDGRCLGRNPRPGPGQPLLVPVLLASADGEDGEDGEPRAPDAPDDGGEHR